MPSCRVAPKLLNHRVAVHDCRLDKKNGLWNQFSHDGERRRVNGGKDARRSQRVSQHALNCVHLAKGASTPAPRDHFAKLARTWIKLADELEQTEAFLAAFEDDEPTKQTG